MAQHSIDSLYLGGMAQFYRVAYLGQGLNVRDEGPSCAVSRHTATISFCDFIPTSLVEICRSYGAIRCLHLYVYLEYGGERRFRNFGRFLRDYTALYSKRLQSSGAKVPKKTPSSRILVSSINRYTFYRHGHAFLRNHDLLNYQMDLKFASPCIIIQLK
jgi:hypothetical protein